MGASSSRGELKEALCGLDTALGAGTGDGQLIGLQCYSALRPSTSLPATTDITFSLPNGSPAVLRAWQDTVLRLRALRHPNIFHFATSDVAKDGGAVHITGQPLCAPLRLESGDAICSAARNGGGADGCAPIVRVSDLHVSEVVFGLAGIVAAVRTCVAAGLTCTSPTTSLDCSRLCAATGSPSGPVRTVEIGNPAAIHRHRWLLFDLSGFKMRSEVGERSTGSCGSITLCSVAKLILILLDAVQHCTPQRAQLQVLLRRQLKSSAAEAHIETGQDAVGQPLATEWYRLIEVLRVSRGDAVSTADNDVQAESVPRTWTDDCSDDGSSRAAGAEELLVWLRNALTPRKGVWARPEPSLAPLTVEAETAALEHLEHLLLVQLGDPLCRALTLGVNLPLLATEVRTAETPPAPSPLAAAYDSVLLAVREIVAEPDGENRGPGCRSSLLTKRIAPWLFHASHVTKEAARPLFRALLTHLKVSRASKEDGLRLAELDEASATSCVDGAAEFDALGAAAADLWLFHCGEPVRTAALHLLPELLPFISGRQHSVDLPLSFALHLFRGRVAASEAILSMAQETVVDAPRSAGVADRGLDRGCDGTVAMLTNALAYVAHVPMLVEHLGRSSATPAHRSPAALARAAATSVTAVANAIEDVLLKELLLLGVTLTQLHREAAGRNVPSLLLVLSQLGRSVAKSLLAVVSARHVPHVGPAEGSVNAEQPPQPAFGEYAMSYLTRCLYGAGPTVAQETLHLLRELVDGETEEAPSQPLPPHCESNGSGQASMDIRGSTNASPGTGSMDLADVAFGGEAIGAALCERARDGDDRVPRVLLDARCVHAWWLPLLTPLTAHGTPAVRKAAGALATSFAVILRTDEGRLAAHWESLRSIPAGERMLCQSFDVTHPLQLENPVAVCLSTAYLSISHDVAIALLGPQAISADQRKWIATLARGDRRACGPDAARQVRWRPLVPTTLPVPAAREDEANGKNGSSVRQGAHAVALECIRAYEEGSRSQAHISQRLPKLACDGMWRQGRQKGAATHHRIARLARDSTMFAELYGITAAQDMLVAFTSLLRQHSKPIDVAWRERYGYDVIPATYIFVYDSASATSTFSVPCAGAQTACHMVVHGQWPPPHVDDTGGLMALLLDAVGCGASTELLPQSYV